MDVLATHPWGRVQLSVLLNLTLLAACLVLALLLARDRHPGLAVLTAGAVLMPLATGSVLSMSRFALLGFPGWLWLAKHLRDRGAAEVAWLLGGAGLGTVALGIVIGGRFLA